MKFVLLIGFVIVAAAFSWGMVNVIQTFHKGIKSNLNDTTEK